MILEIDKGNLCTKLRLAINTLAKWGIQLLYEPNYFGPGKGHFLKQTRIWILSLKSHIEYYLGITVLTFWMFLVHHRDCLQFILCSWGLVIEKNNLNCTRKIKPRQSDEDHLDTLALQTFFAIKEAIFWCQLYTNFKQHAMSTTPFVEFDLSQKWLRRLITGSHSSFHTAMVSSGTQLKKHLHELQGEHSLSLRASPGLVYSGCPSALPYGRCDTT